MKPRHDRQSIPKVAATYRAGTNHCQDSDDESRSHEKTAVGFLQRRKQR